MESRLVFHHQDGELCFRVVAGVYNVSESDELSCSAICAPNEDLEFMAAPHFAVLRVPLTEALHTNQSVAVRSEAEAEETSEQGPSVHLYVGEHSNPWGARIKVLSVGPNSIDVHVSFISVDPNYYDERARPTEAELWATLRAGPFEAVWSPL